MNNGYKNFILEGKILRKIYQVYSVEKDFQKIDEELFININDSLEEILEVITSILNIYNEEFNKDIDYKLSFDKDSNLSEGKIIFNINIENIDIKVFFKKENKINLVINMKDDLFIKFLEDKRTKNKELIMSAINGTDNKVHFYHALSILMGTL